MLPRGLLGMAGQSETIPLSSKSKWVLKPVHHWHSWEKLKCPVSEVRKRLTSHHSSFSHVQRVHPLLLNLLFTFSCNEWWHCIIGCLSYMPWPNCMQMVYTSPNTALSWWGEHYFAFRTIRAHHHSRLHSWWVANFIFFKNTQMHSHFCWREKKWCKEILQPMK